MGGQAAKGYIRGVQRGAFPPRWSHRDARSFARQRFMSAHAAIRPRCGPLWSSWCACQGVSPRG